MRKNVSLLGRGAALFLALIMILTSVQVPVYASGDNSGVFGFSGEKTVEENGDQVQDRDEDLVLDQDEDHVAEQVPESDQEIPDADKSSSEEKAELTLAQQTIPAEITTEPTVKGRARTFARLVKGVFSAHKKATEITLTGLLPESASVEAYPVTVEIPGQEVLVAFDITIYVPVLNENGEETGEREVWQPDESVTVSISDAALADESDVQIYHMEEPSAEPEIIDTTTVNNGEVLFDANSFSIYAVAKTVLEQTVLASNGNTYKIIVSYDENSGLPTEQEGAQLSVSEILNEEELADVNAAIDTERAENRKVALSRTFDIKILDKDGTEVQPNEGASVQVAFELVQVGNQNLTTEVYHLKNEGDTLTAEPLTVDSEDEEAHTATVLTGGFSYFTVEFTYEGKQYVLPGDGSSIKLADLLAAIGITGEVTDIEVSNDYLIVLYKENDEWYVAGEEAFDTEEWMHVTIDGIVYEITVTDDFLPTEGTGNTSTDFARNLDIATLHIADLSNWDNKTVDSQGLELTEGTSAYGYKGALPSNAVKSLGNSSLTVTYHNAATAADGTTYDVQVIFDNIKIYPWRDANIPENKTTETGEVTKEYYYTVATSKGMAGNCPTDPSVRIRTNIVDSEYNMFRFGVEEDITVKIVGANGDSPANETFVLSVYDLNLNKTRSKWYAKILDADSHECFSEMAKLESGFGDVYYNSNGNIVQLNATTLRGNGGGASWASGFAGVVPASGATFTVCAGGGASGEGAELFVMTRKGITHNVTSGSGFGGSISTTTTGAWDTIGTSPAVPEGAAELSGGTVTTPYTYGVPAGKKVSYLLKPAQGYALDTVSVDGMQLVSYDSATKTYTHGSSYTEYSNLKDSSGNAISSSLTGREGCYVYTFPAVNGTHSISVTWRALDDLQIPIGHIGLEPGTGGNVTMRNLQGTLKETMTEGTDYYLNTTLSPTGAEKKVGDGSAVKHPDIPGYTFFTYVLGAPLKDEEGGDLGGYDQIPSGTAFYAASDDLYLRYTANGEYEYSVNEPAGGQERHWETWNVTDENGDPIVPTIYAVYTKADTDTSHTVYATVTAIAKNETDPSFVDPNMDISYSYQIDESNYKVTVDQPAGDNPTIKTTKDSETAGTPQTFTLKPGQSRTFALTYQTSESQSVGKNDNTQSISGTVTAERLHVTQTWTNTNYTLESITLKHGQRGAVDINSQTYTIYTVARDADAKPTATRSENETSYTYTFGPADRPNDTEVEFINKRETVQLSLAALLDDPSLNPNDTHDFSVTVRAIEKWDSVNSQGQTVQREHYSMLGTKVIHARNGQTVTYTAPNGDAFIEVPKNSDILLIQRLGASGSQTGVLTSDYDTTVTSDPEGITGYRSADKEYIFRGISENTTVTFREILKPRVVTVKKTVIGGDLAEEYDFTATLTDADGAPVADYLVYTDINGTEHRTDASGLVYFTLKGNGFIELKLPYKASLTVEEASETDFTTRYSVDNGAETDGSSVTLSGITENKEIKFINTSKFSVYDSADTVTYEFYLDAGFTTPYNYTLSGTYPDLFTNKQVLRDGSVLVEPEQPNSKKAFKGWYRSDGSQETGFGTTITVDAANKGTTIKLYAQFADVVYAVFHGYEVSEKNGSGDETKYWPVWKTVEIEKTEGKYQVDFSSVGQPGINDSTKSFQGWALTPENASAGTNTLDSADPYTISETTHFYPATQWKVRVSFYTGEAGTGAPYIATVLIDKGAAAGTALPAENPEWTGYIFDGWYKTYDESTDNYTDRVTSTSTDAVNEDITLYAKWSPGTANYTVALWYQKADYEYGDAFDMRGYVYQKSVILSGTTESEVTVADETAAAERFGQIPKGFHYWGADTKHIAGDGSTVVNVYYDRDVYKLTIKPIKHAPDPPSHSDYSFTGTLGENGYVEVKTPSGAPLYGSTDGGSKYFQISLQQIGWVPRRDKTNYTGTTMCYGDYPVYPLSVQAFSSRRISDSKPLSAPVRQNSTVYLDSADLGISQRARDRVEATPLYWYVQGTSYSDNPTVYPYGFGDSSLKLYELKNADTIELSGLYGSAIVGRPTEYRYIARNQNKTDWDTVTPLSTFNWDLIVKGRGDLSADEKEWTIYATDNEICRKLVYYKLGAGKKLSEYKDSLKVSSAGEMASLSKEDGKVSSVQITNPDEKFDGYGALEYRTFLGSAEKRVWHNLRVKDGTAERYSYGLDKTINLYWGSSSSNLNPIGFGSSETSTTEIATIQTLFVPKYQNLIFRFNQNAGASWVEDTLKVYTDNTLGFDWVDEEDQATLQVINRSTSPEQEEEKYNSYLKFGKRANGSTFTHPEGLVFAGWYMDEACTVPFDPKSEIVTNTTFVYAKWEKPWYVVQVDPNGGELTGTSSGGPTWFWLHMGDKVTSYDNIITRNYDEYDEGEYYYHKDQYEDYQGTYDYDADSSVTISGSTVIPDGTYNLNGYTNPTHSAKYDTNSTQPNDGKRYRELQNAWKLVRWDYKYRNADGTWPDAWQEHYLFSKPVDNHLKLRAIWEKQVALRINYDYANGTAQDASEEGLPLSLDDETRYSENALVTISRSAKPNTTGMHFLGWKVKGGDGTLYPVGSVYTAKTADADSNLTITLVAQYGRMEMTSLGYNANEGTGTLTDVSPAEETQQWDGSTNTLYDIELNTAVALSGGAGFTRTGYKLIGWSKAPLTFVKNESDQYVTDDEDKTPITTYFTENSGVYTPADGQENICFRLGNPAEADPRKVVVDGATGNVLYAVWIKMPYTVLNVTKTVAGAMGDTTREFDFTLSGLKNGTEIKWKKYETTDGSNVEDISTAEDGSITFTLKHNQKIALSVPAGSVLALEESEATGYATNMVLTKAEDGTNVSGSDGATITFETSEDLNLAVTNTLGDIAPTGVRTVILPFALILAAGAVFFLFYRRRWGTLD